jgi:hypothetical protein
MKRTTIGLYALLGLLAAGRAWSQEPLKAPAAAQKPPAEPAATATPAGVYEEIEILRRLLNQGLKAAYGLPEARSMVYVGGYHNVRGQMVAQAADGQRHPAGAEGVYVKGCGVVYSATLPPPVRSPLPLAAPAASAPPSAWDQARAELRGEKLRTPEASAADRQVPLAEAVLRVLAENGRHFRHLPDDERITVALTFRRSPLDSSVSPSGSVSVPVEVWRTPQGTPYIVGAASPFTATAQDANSFEPEIPLKETQLGDLHARQKRWGDAARAYEEALRALEHTLHSEKERTGKMEVKTLLAMGEVANKLAQVSTAQGNNERVRHFLKLAGRAATLAEEAAGGKPAPAGSIPLPSRLVISAPKKILDQVGAGKMTFEEFRKAATVEYLTFPPADKAGTKGQPGANP